MASPPPFRAGPSGEKEQLPSPATQGLDPDAADGPRAEDQPHGLAGGKKKRSDRGDGREMADAQQAPPPLAAPNESEECLGGRPPPTPPPPRGKQATGPSAQIEPSRKVPPERGEHQPVTNCAVPEHPGRLPEGQRDGFDPLAGRHGPEDMHGDL